MEHLNPPNQPFTSVFTLPLFRLALLAGFIILVINRYLQPALFLLFLLITIETARIWSNLGIRKLVVERKVHPDRLFPDEQTLFTIHLKNNKIIPVGLRFIEPLSPEVILFKQEKAGVLSDFTFLKWYDDYTANYPLQALKRGYFRLEPLCLESSDGLGLFRRRIAIDDTHVIMVYPRLRTLEELQLNPADLMGNINDCRPLLPDPIRIAGLRDYTPDMPARYIHWKASAHKDDLLAKVLEPSADLRICIAVDVEAFCKSVSQEEAFEVALSVAASLAFWADNNKIPFGLLVNGVQKELGCQIIVPVSASYQQMNITLESLARLEYKMMGTLADLLKIEGSHLPWGTTLVIIGDGNLVHVPGGVRNVVYYDVYQYVSLN